MSKVKDAEVMMSTIPAGGTIELPPPRGDADMLMVEAVRSGNIEVMERVMAIRRELKAEAAKEAFFAAMASFQAECPVIKRTKVVKSEKGWSYRYAPLDQIVKQVGPIIAKHGLSYTIKADIEQGEKETFPRLVARTYVHHGAGHSEFSEFSVPIDSASSARNKQQDMGNANTYAKRYSFCNAFGLMTEDEDTDGISPNDARQARQPVSQPRETPSAQKAAQKGKAAQESGDRPDLEPAPAGEGIEPSTINGLAKAMQQAKLAQADFLARFPKLTGLEQVKRTDSRVILSWIADPRRN